MVVFFTSNDGRVYAVDTNHSFESEEIERLNWLFGNAHPLAEGAHLPGSFVGPRKEMITPWSTNAVEITQNMGLGGISSIEMFIPAGDKPKYDPMLQTVYTNPGADVFCINAKPAPQEHIADIHE